MRTKSEIAEEIWRISLQEIVCSGALGQAVRNVFVDFCEAEETGTDGGRFYYEEDSFLALYEEQGQKGIQRLLFHTLFHLLYLNHTEKKTQDPLHHLAWDINVEYTIDCMGLEALTGKMSGEAQEICREIWQGETYMNSQQIYQKLLDLKLTPEMIESWSSFFFRDSHKLWKKPGEEELRRILKAAGLVKAGIQSQGKAGIGRRGNLPGQREEWYQVQEQRKADYRRFLRKFFVEREELQTDMESFDYIPYLYGLKRYGNLPIIEHLEYTEARKTQELVLAIDTSSSCKKEEVQRFLEETWKILSSRENFFRKMNIHIIQCDCYVQEDMTLTCEREWKEYMKNIRIQGRGGTDFRPVFRYIEKLTEEGKFQNLKGLFYFTDGDGIYPKQKPYYETAFLLTREPPKEANVPEWAELIYLPQKE